MKYHVETVSFWFVFCKKNVWEFVTKNSGHFQSMLYIVNDLIKRASLFNHPLCGLRYAYGGYHGLLAQRLVGIYKLLNLRAEKVQPYEFDNVQIVYFDNETDAIEYIDFMSREKNFVSIEQTEYKSKMDNKMTKEKVYHGSLGTHDVIGREYDNVLVVMDEGFEHDEEGRLRYRNLSGYYPYLGDHQMFQSLTRVRKELIIVVLKNPELYHTIQNIINWKNKKLYGKHQNAKVKSNS